MQGVQARRELRLQGVVDSTVPRQPGEAGQDLRPDPNRIVGLASRGGAGMPMVKVGLIHYIQLRRGKSSSQGSSDTLRAACQFLRH